MAEKESKTSTASTKAEAKAETATPAKPSTGTSKSAKSAKSGTSKSASAKSGTSKAAKSDAPAKKEAPKAAASEDKGASHTPRIKPELDDAAKEALGLRRDKKSKTPRFRRQEWWRYKDLGGKHAPWRRPNGIHSKMRRHIGYRPPVVSIGYRGPAAARGLHPSGFEEVLVHRPADLEGLDPKTQAARVGRTVGGRKAEAIESQAATLGIRILNPRGES